MNASEQPKLGLRERKKIKTRETIQQHAIRLFREQGYSETTIEQIAEAAEISPSTFFRYFPTKEALVLDDDYDPLLIQAFREQPPGLSSIQALRNAVRSGLAEISEEGRKAISERMLLAMNVPEVRAASFNQMMNTMRMLTELLSARTGRTADDFRVITFAGAVMGVFMSTQTYSAAHLDEDYIKLFDQALAQLEAGLPLPSANE